MTAFKLWLPHHAREKNTSVFGAKMALLFWKQSKTDRDRAYKRKEIYLPSSFTVDTASVLPFMKDLSSEYFTQRFNY